MIKKLHAFIRSQLGLDDISSVEQKRSVVHSLLQQALTTKAKPRDQSSYHQSSLLQKLEPRFMFDGAGLGTIDLADGISAEEQAGVLDALNANEHVDAGKSLFDALGLDLATQVTDYSQYQEVVIIDGRVKDPQVLIGEVNRKAAIEVILPDEDGVEAIAKILAKYRDLSAVHIISHGSQGELQLGNITLNGDNLATYQSQLGAWGQALSGSGDILFYGCNVAEGDKGQTFVEELKALTRADIAASSNLTASNTHGGDGKLEYATDIDVDEILGFEQYSYVLINQAPTLQLAWQQLGVDINGEASGDQSGNAVAMSADGTRVAIGARYNDGGGADSGHVRVYDWNGTGWVQVGQDINGGANNQSGYSIAMTADGTRVVIGALGDVNIRVYDYNGSTWEQTGVFSNPITPAATYSIAIDASGTHIVVGAPTTSGGAFTWQGAVTVYSWDGGSWSMSWSKYGEASGDQTGYSVAMSADGSKIAVGSIGKDDNGISSGQVRIYSWGGSAWMQQGASLNGEATVNQQGQLGDSSGFSVSMSADGSIVAIGAPRNDGNGLESGDVRVYRWNNNGGFWVQLGNDIDGEAAGDQSGWSVAMSADGTRIAIGATENDGNGSNSGQVRIYSWSESAWAWKQFAADLDGEAAGDQSGYALAMSADGTRLIIGAINNSGNGTASGQARIYHLGVNYTENAQIALNSALSVSDGDSINLASARISISSNYVSGQDSLGFTNMGGITGTFNATTGVLTLTGTASLATYQNALRSITYYNTSDNPNTATRTISWVVNDGQADSTTINSKVYIKAVHDAPVATNSTVTVLKNTTHVFTSDEFQFTDVDGDSMSHIMITSLENAGALKLDGVDVALNQTISKAQLDAGRLSFTPVSNASGFPYASFGYKVNDGTADSLSSYTMTVNVNNVPTAANNTININEDSIHAFSANEFNFSDIDGNSIAGIRVTTLESTGALKLYGLNVGLNQLISKADMDAGQFTFIPGLNASGSAYDSFSFKVNDGFADSVNSYTMTINVTAVNDAPKLSTNAAVESWQQLGLISNGNEAGQSVAVSADGLRIAVGEASSDSFRGSVRVYEWNGSAWSQMGLVIAGEAIFDQSGHSIAMNADGTRLAIGAPVNDGDGSDVNYGQVRIYEWKNGAWTRMGQDIDGEIAREESGYAVSMSADGSRVAIGAPHSDINGINSGYVRVLYWNGSSWLQLGDHIKGNAGAFSGYSISLSADGKRLAIGSPSYDGTSATGYKGQVKIYEWNDSTWVQTGADINGDVLGDSSGSAVSLNADGTYVAIGAPGNDGNGTGSGQVKVYHLVGNDWMKVGNDIYGTAGDGNGESVAISSDGTRVVIGAIYNGANGTWSGRTRAYDYDGSSWRQVGTNIDGAAWDRSGESVAVSADGKRIVVGAIGNGTQAKVYQVADTTVHYTENMNPVTLDSKIIITDVDNTQLTGAIVKISSNYAIGQDLLGFFNTSTITGNFNVMTGILTLGGVDTLAAYQAALRSVTYYNASDNPSTLERTLSWTVSDGAVNSTAMTSKIVITAVNDVPTASNKTVTLLEDKVYVFNASDFGFADIDGGALASIQITSLENVGSLKVDGVDVTLNRVITRAEIDGGKLTFTPLLNGNANGYDGFNFKVNDGTDDSLTSYTMTVNVTAVNDLPVVFFNGSWSQLGSDIDGTALGDNSGNAVAISDNGLRMVVGAFNNDSNGTDSGQVKIYEYNGSNWVQLGNSINGNTAGDKMGMAVSINADGTRIAIGSPFIDSNGVDSGQVKIYQWNAQSKNWGQLGGDINGEAAWDNSGLSIAMSADGSRVVIGASFNDGNGTDSGHVRIYSWSGSSWVKLGQDIDGEVAFDNSGGAVDISADGNIVAIGAAGNAGNGTRSGHVRIYSWSGSSWVKLGQHIDGEVAFDNSGLSVALNGDGKRVAIGAPFNDGNGSNSGQVRIYDYDGSAWVQVGTDIDGEAANDWSGRSVTLSADGARVAIGAVLNDGNGTDSGQVRVYEYRSGVWVQVGVDIDGEAAGDNSGIAISLSSDGTRLAIGAAANGSGKGHVRVYQFGQTINYIENDPTTVVNGNVIVTDVDNPTLQGATVSISRNFVSNQDILAFTNIGNITGNYNAATGVLTLTGQDTLANYQAVLRSVTYRNTSDNPSTLERTIKWTVNDGQGDSTAMFNLISITAVNDPPQISISANLTYTEKASATALDSGLIVSDDSIDLVGATVQISGNYIQGQDLLAFVNTSKITGQFNVATGVLSLSGSDTVANYQAALRSVTYQNASSNPSTVTRTLSWRLDDGLLISSPVTSSLNVIAVNDAPEIIVGKLWTQLGVDINGKAAVDQSGWSVSMSADGTRIAVGALGNDDNGTNSGHVRVYAYNGSAWVQLGQDINGEAASDFSGGSISLSGDGTTLAIGATKNDGNGSDSGHVRIYRYNGSAWVQAGADIDGESAGEENGRAVALNNTGTRIVIGSPFNSSNGFLSGYARIFEWNGNAWVQLGQSLKGEAGFDFSGTAVSINANGTRVAIGANGNDGNGNNSGHVRVYEYNGSAWIKLGSDIDGEAANDGSGISVSLSADGERLAIGASGNDGNGTDSGHVRIYRWNGNAWVQLGSDINGEAAGDQSGFSVALSADGSQVAIAAHTNDGNGSNSGHVRIYRWSGSAWIKVGADIDGEAADDQSGYSVAMSADGARIIIGAPNNDGNGTDSGHVRVYALTTGGISYNENDPATILDNSIVLSDVDHTQLVSATVTISGNYANNQDILTFTNTPNITGSFNATTGVLTLTGTDTVANYQAALRSVSYKNTSDNPSTLTRTVSWVVNDGSNHANAAMSTIKVTAVNDAPRLAVNELWVQLGLDIDGEAAGDQSGWSVSMSANGTRVAIGAPSNDGNGSNSGQVRVYDWNGTTWGKVGADIDGESANDSSGGSISLSADGTTLAIGATGNDGNGSDSGHVRIYRYNGSVWVQMGSDINGESGGDQSRRSVSLNNNGSRVVIGAVFNSSNGFLSGNVRVFEWSGSAWVQLGQSIKGEAGFDFSGTAVSINADASIIAIGAPLNDGNGSDSGHVRVYQYNGTSWVKLGQDIDGEAANDHSGFSVALSSDGLKIAIGAPNNSGNGSNGGHVRVYSYNSGTWEKVGNDIDGQGGDQSGWSVSLSADGNMVAIGAYQSDANGFDSGQVRIYRYDGSNWIKIGSDINGEAAWDNSGAAVAISADGKRVIIGAYGNDGSNGSDYGQARIYSLEPTSITYRENDPATVINSTIKVSDFDDTHLEGASVSISSNYIAGQDILSFASTASITGSFNTTTGVLTLTGSDTVANYQTVLRSVTYRNTSETPNTATRTISWVVNDGSLNSSLVNTTIKVVSINDIPTSASKVFTMDKNTAYAFAVADFKFTDIDGDAFDYVKITTLPTAGSLQFNGVAVTLGQRITLGNLGLLTFTPTVGTHGMPYASFGFKVSDGLDESTNAYTMTINVTDAVYVENAPAIFVNPEIVINVDSTTFSGARITISNYVAGEDSLAFSALGNISGQFNDTTGILTLSGVDTREAYQLALRAVSYHNTSDNPNTDPRTIIWVINDGNTDFNIAANAITVIRVNDAPTGISNIFTINEDSTLVFTSSDFGVSDVDGGPRSEVIIKSLPAAGNLRLNGESVVANQRIPVESLGLLSFTPAANGNGAPYTSFGFKLSDGEDESEATYTMTINVTSVNDATIISAGSVSNYNENNAALVIDSALTISDVDNTTLQSATIRVSSNYQSGEDILAFSAIGSISGKFDETTGILALSGTDTLANYQTALRSVTYRNTSENPNTSTRMISWSVNDGYSESSTTSMITITAVNDAPTAASNTLTIDEDTIFTFSASDFGFTDVDGDSLAKIIVTSLPTAGSLKFNGVAVTSNQSIAVASLGSLSFTPVANANGILYASFGFRVNDGVLDSSAAYTMTINVRPVNDAPIIGAGSVSTYRENDPAVVIDSGFTVSDVDHATLQGATIQISTNYRSGEDILSFSATGNRCEPWRAEREGE